MLWIEKIGNFAMYGGVSADTAPNAEHRFTTKETSLRYIKAEPV